jgi:hypothetical protein
MEVNAMTILKTIAVIFSLALASTLLVPAAHAGVWNEKMELNFNHSVEIPGTVLPAGSYWFVLMNSPSNRNVVEIYNASQSHLLATVITHETLRPNTTSDTEVVLAERHHSQPEALWKLYYPGLYEGHEFTYPRSEEARLRLDAKQIATAPLIVSNVNAAG